MRRKFGKVAIRKEIELRMTLDRPWTTHTLDRIARRELERRQTAAALEQVELKELRYPGITQEWSTMILERTK